MAIGITEVEFWTMNPRRVNLRIKARQKALDAQARYDDYLAWLFGRYEYEAMAVALDNVLNGKKSRAKYRDKPLSDEMNEQPVELTEEEKHKRTEKFFLQLQIMQNNFEMTHGVGGE